MIDMRQVNSANIHSIGYDAANKELHVEFKGRKGYVYKEVSPEIYAKFKGSQSLTKFLNANIKGKHEYRRL